MPVFPRRRRAASLSNYALLAGLVATIAIGALVVAGGRTGCLLQQASFGLVGDESACAPAGPPVSPPPPPGSEGNRAPQVSDRTLPRANLGALVSVQMQGTDPDGDALTWTLGGGALPAGLTLDSSGLLSGIPTEGGAFSFTVVAADAHGLQGSGQITLVVNRPPAIVSTGLLPSPLVVGSPVSISLVGSDPDGDALTWSLDDGALPEGLTLAPDGTLAGTPTGAGATFTVRAQDPDGLAATAQVRLNAAPVFATPAALPLAIAGQALSRTLGATDPDGQPVAVTLTAGNLPAGVSLSPAGVLNGTPTIGGVFTFTVQATDPDGATATRTFTLEVGGAPTFLTAEGLLGSYQIGVPASFAVVAEDSGSGVLSYALAGGSVLPDGLTLADDGTIEGTPTAGGTTFTVRATNSATGLSAERTFRLNAAPQIQTPAGPADPGYVVGSAYDLPLVATDPEGAPLVWTLAGGSLPASLSLDPSGRIQGIVATPGVTSALLRATDPDGGFAEVLLTFAPDNRPRWTTAPLLPTATNRGVSYNVQVQAVGEGTIRYGVAPGSALPAGMTINANTGRIQGSPTGPGGTTAEVVLRATDPQGRFRDQTFQIPINDRPHFTSSASSFTYGPFPIGVPISPIQLPVADADDTPTCVQTSPPPVRLPAGLSMEPGCMISGTPTSAVSIAGYWRATDGKATSSGNPLVRITTYVPSFNLTPFTIPDLTYASFAAPAQNTSPITLTGGFTETLTARIVGPRAVTLRINGTDRGTGTDVSFPVGPGGTVQVRGVQNPSDGAFDSIDEYTLSLEAPGVGVVYQTSFAAIGPTRIMDVVGLTFNSIPTQAVGATNIQTNVTQISGFNDRVRIRVSGDSGFALRIGGTSSTCTANPIAATSAAGAEVAADAGTTGQATTTAIRVCLSGLAAPSALSETRSWTVTAEDPKTGAVLAQHSLNISTPLRDPVPTLQSLVTTNDAYFFGAVVETRRSTSNNNVSSISGFNTQLRAELVGPRPASIRLFGSSSVLCSSTPALESPVQINPTLAVGSNLTAVGASNSFGICVRTTAPTSFDAVDTYELRFFDPLTNDLVASTSFQVRAISRDPEPNAITFLGTATGAMPYDQIAYSAVRVVNGFNTPLRLAVTAPAGAGIGAQLRAGSSITCSSNPVVATAIPGQTVVSASTFGNEGVPNTINICLMQIGTGPAFSATQIYTVSTVNPITNLPTRSTSYTIYTQARDPNPQLTSSFGHSAIYHSDQLPGAVLTPPTSGSATIATLASFNVALEGIFHGPRAFALRTSTQSSHNACGDLTTLHFSSFNAETGRHEVRIAYDPNGVSPGRGSGVGIDANANNRFHWCFAPGPSPVTAPAGFGAAEPYGADFIDPATGAVVLSSATTPGAQMVFTTVPRSTTPSGMTIPSVDGTSLNTTYRMTDVFDGISAPTLFRASDTTPGWETRILVTAGSSCPTNVSSGFPAGAAAEVLFPASGAIHPSTQLQLCVYTRHGNAYGETNTVRVTTIDPMTSAETATAFRDRSTVARDDVFEDFPAFGDLTVPAGAEGQTVPYHVSSPAGPQGWQIFRTVNVPFQVRVSGPRPLSMFGSSGTATTGSCSGSTPDPSGQTVRTFNPVGTTFAYPYTGNAISAFRLCISEVRRPAPGQSDFYTIEAIELDRLTGAPTSNVLRSHTFIITAP